MALAGAKERARRASCKSNVRQFLVALHLYGGDNEERLPSGLSDNFNPEDEHTPILSTATRNAQVQLATTDKIFNCPWLREPFNKAGGWTYIDYGYVIGYNYLGGHQGTRWPAASGGNQWISPQTLSGDPTLPIVTELNAWSTSEDKSFAPHGTTGPIMQEGTGGRSSADIGGAGGHIGLLDGSVTWKDLRQMKIYRGSRLWDADGCITAW